MVKTLFKGGEVVNVFTDMVEKVDVLIEDDKIIGIGNYYEDSEADVVVDVTSKVLCPGFIEGHIHIESSHLLPSEFTKACLSHGTTSIVADPHEIVNVCGKDGMDFMLEASKGLPINMYYVLPSCVPACHYEEAGDTFTPEVIRSYYGKKGILGLGEMMNSFGVVHDDPEVLQKLKDARDADVVINGHAPLLTGKDLDKYIAAGIHDDHECSMIDEAKERIRKGQWVMIRDGTAAKNLWSLLDLFEEPWNRRCMLVSDDRQPLDLLKSGQIDSIIRHAMEKGMSPIVAIRMATIQAATHFGFKDHGAIAPGFKSDIIVLDSLDTIKIKDVYHNGVQVVFDGKAKDFDTPKVDDRLWNRVRDTFDMDAVSPEDFHIEPKGRKVNVIKVTPKELITNSAVMELDFSKDNGVDVTRDVVKLAVIERHKHTGHRSVGFVTGIGLKSGAIASSVAHDAHNLIVVGTNDQDMAVAANRVRELKGGFVAVKDGKVLAEMPLPIGGLMNDASAEEIANQNESVRNVAYDVLGIPRTIRPFMCMSFISLSVIPELKMTTFGLVDVATQQIIPLFMDE